MVITTTTPPTPHTTCAMPPEPTPPPSAAPTAAINVVQATPVEQADAHVEMRGRHLHGIIAGYSALSELREALAAEIGVRRLTRTGQWALDVVTIAVAMWHERIRRGDPQQDYLGRLVDVLLHAVAKLGGSVRMESKAEVFTWRDRVICAEAALYVLVGVPRSIHAMTRNYFHLPDGHEHALASALIMPTRRLGGCKWHSADAPIALVRKKAVIYHRVDDLYLGGGEIARSDAMYCARTPKLLFDEKLKYDRARLPHRGTVTLEEITDELNEVATERRYSIRAVDELRRAAEGDADLTTYFGARISIGGRPQDTWRALGWTDARGRRVDRRFRRLCVGLRGRTELADVEYRPARSHWSAGSRNVYREVLFGGRFGSGTFVFQHMPLQPRD